MRFLSASAGRIREVKLASNIDLQDALQVVETIVRNTMVLTPKLYCLLKTWVITDIHVAKERYLEVISQHLQFNCVKRRQNGGSRGWAAS